MTDHKPSCSNKIRPSRALPAPLDTARLQELALAYVARFATTSAKLERYLSRKIRERGWNDDDGKQTDSRPDLAQIAAHFVELGYIDDEAYARSRSGGLLRRGFGPRRVSQDLQAAGINEQVRNDLAPGEAAIRKAALAMARKRRFGPFANADPSLDPKQALARKQKQIAAMLRAGHGFETASAIMNAPDVAAAVDWAADTQDEDW